MKDSKDKPADKRLANLTASRFPKKPSSPAKSEHASAVAGLMKKARAVNSGSAGGLDSGSMGSVE